jgi:hypothetical protein
MVHGLLRSHPSVLTSDEPDPDRARLEATGQIFTPVH